MPKLRKDSRDDTLYYDDSGETQYLWCHTRGTGNAIHIWTKAYYDREKYVCDVCSSFIDEVLDGDGFSILDGTFDKDIGDPLRALGFDEVSESYWAADDQAAGDITPMLDFVKSHPRIQHCPEME